MKSLIKIYQEWNQDKSLGEVIKNTGYMVTSNTATTGLTFVQGMLAAIILGPLEYGVLGMIVTFASNVNRLLSFRMGELVVKFAGESIEKGDKTRAAAIIKFAGLAEIITSVIAYLLLVLLAPWAAKVIFKDVTITPWIMIYGLALLANFMTETSTAILQIGDQFRKLAIINFIQSLVTAIWIVVIFFTQGNLNQVLMAYLVWNFHSWVKFYGSTHWKRLVEGSIVATRNKKSIIQICFQHKYKFDFKFDY
jgi:O-antigen/teichoic acid export membrane protein